MSDEKTIRHAISIDLEDWYQSTIDEAAPLSDRFVASTHKVMESLAAAGVKGTFFVLGMAAEKAPALIRELVQAGHEVQSHGYGHRSNFHLTPAQFEEDLLHARKLLEDLTGCPVYGYRAPCFSIDERNLWALDVLAMTGHRYDSSIFPVKKSRYGIDDYEPSPRLLTLPGGGRIVEAPVACFDWLGRRRAVGGGGYFRLWPRWVLHKAWRQIERAGRPGIIYMHPYEYDPSEMTAFRSRLSLKTRLHQGLGRRGFPGKVDSLLRAFGFGPIRDVLADLLKQV
jgi:polysaccharide deacetylase family protein (PEP-CTERM system associated)